MKGDVAIANAQAFWGDRTSAAANILSKDDTIDFVTFDYLAEVSMSIMAIQKEKNPTLGYAQDFVEVVKSIIPFWQRGSKVKLIANAGGLNPKACADACYEILKQNSCHKKIGIVSGDDVLGILQNNPGQEDYRHLETKESLSTILPKLVTANAYMGADPIVEALKLGADIIITGRIADPSLTVAAAAYHHSWNKEQYPQIANATVAGHVIECGTQATGGISTNWLEIKDYTHIGFPIATIASDGSFRISKSSKSGGVISIDDIKEQLLYEIGDPANYLSPDATVSFLTLELAEEKDGVAIRNATGSMPPQKLKVSATYRAGYKAEGFLGFVGENAKLKAERAAEIIETSLNEKGLKPQDFYFECLGTNAIVPNKNARDDLSEVILRVAVSDPKKEAVEAFSKEIAPLVTAGPPGTCGYTSGRPQVRPVFGYWPCLIDRDLILPKVEILEEGL